MPDDPHPLVTTSPRAPGRVPGPAAVLWDMDGTVVDTEPFWIRAETEMVAAHGGTWTRADAHAVVGSDMLDAAAYLQRVGGVEMEAVDIVTTLTDRVVEMMAGSPPWQPGAVELLGSLRAEGVACALVTMSWRRLAEAVVDLLPPGTFAATVVGDEVERGKPHPEPYLTAARLLGVEAAACAAIEDSPTGARSAKAAGCFVVGVPHVVALPDDVVDVIVPSLAGLDVVSLRRLVAR